MKTASQTLFVVWKKFFFRPSQDLSLLARFGFHASTAVFVFLRGRVSEQNESARNSINRTQDHLPTILHYLPVSACRLIIFGSAVGNIFFVYALLRFGSAVGNIFFVYVLSQISSFQPSPLTSCFVAGFITSSR